MNARRPPKFDATIAISVPVMIVCVGFFAIILLSCSSIAIVQEPEPVVIDQLDLDGLMAFMKPIFNRQGMEIRREANEALIPYLTAGCVRATRSPTAQYFGTMYNLGESKSRGNTCYGHEPMPDNVAEWLCEMSDMDLLWNRPEEWKFACMPRVDTVPEVPEVEMNPRFSFMS